MSTWTARERLDAELLDTLQAECLRDDRPLTFRTRETQRSWPRPMSRRTPLLICPYCGARRCIEHEDLPALDPFFNA